jgi:hypothetical protein
MEYLVPWCTVLEANSRCVGQYIPHRLQVVKLYNIYSKIHPWISIIKSVEQPHAFTLYTFALLRGLGRHQIYVAHCSRTKEPSWLWLCEGTSSSSDCHLFPAPPPQNLCCHILKGNCETETAVTRWLLTQGIDWCQQRKEKLLPWYDKCLNCRWGFVEKWRDGGTVKWEFY